MDYQLATANSQSSLIRTSFFATSAVFIVTAFHHFYGAEVYNTPWRKDVGVNGGITLLICLIFLYLYNRYKKRIFLILYTLIDFIFFGLVIGIFEGLYNHVLKDILYFSGMPFDTWRHFFPAPTYETPNDFIFESTGVLQFFVAAALIYYLIRVYKMPAKATV
ncbi:hypothetical protein [Solitalea canadensis]|uniref:Uncharacterized protein n=1 Tax=Solitalea canadensis (strain ATCC 29591 / DSM 3403 / JCM 21819 / LMG 8368 / NBRC 15130 / NCIMB 12057 / USAM 9D) TaxID=929556 RepID=H8KUY1_SOLCM|nr:hypothetical protein [Solitalea canadensis]AFD07681.1 hypothetical protein Solca_2647 [Solitalea canadensis DSM 3403]